MSPSIGKRDCFFEKPSRLGDSITARTRESFPESSSNPGSAVTATYVSESDPRSQGSRGRFVLTSLRKIMLLLFAFFNRELVIFGERKQLTTKIDCTAVDSVGTYNFHRFLPDVTLPPAAIVAGIILVIVIHENRQPCSRLGRISENIRIKKNHTAKYENDQAKEKN